MSEENKAEALGFINNENDILQTAVDYMRKFLDTAGRTVTEFRDGNYSRLVSINELFEGFQWIYMAVNKIQSEYQAKIAIDQDRIKETLTNAIEALKNSDAALLTDIIEYDVIEMVREWFGAE